MKTHILKIHKKYWDRVISGEKSFEIRKNDRDFQAGDLIAFEIIFDVENIQSDLDLPFFRITYVLHYPDWLKEWFVGLAIKKLKK